MNDLEFEPDVLAPDVLKSLAITSHDQMTCDLCKGAGTQRDEHYALGKLRFAIGAELGYPRDQSRQLDMSTLVTRWHEHRKENPDAERPVVQPVPTRRRNTVGAAPRSGKAT